MPGLPSLDFKLPEEVEAILQSSEFLYVANPGNAGDCVIACGTHRYFDRKGWKYKVVPTTTPTSETAGRTLVYAGGGNLIGIYPDAKIFMTRHLPGAARFIMLPHTVRDNEELLASLDERCVIVAREERSYRHLLEHLGRAKTYLGHDMAFALDVDGLFRDGARRFLPLFSNRELFRNNLGRLRRQVRRLALARGNRKVLNAFRTDSESTDVELPRDNLDVSRVFGVADMTPTNCLETTYRMMKYINSFKRINTNRLHMAICGALLGKEVAFHANSYSKNEDVYRHSLAARFPKVEWKG